MKPKPYMNPYLAGVFLGLILLGTIYVTGRGLGASGAVKSFVANGIAEVAPEYTRQNSFISSYVHDRPEGHLQDPLVTQFLGVIIGDFISGVPSPRLNH